jgi:hypothetical protein
VWGLFPSPPSFLSVHPQEFMHGLPIASDGTQQCWQKVSVEEGKNEGL